MAEQVEMLPGTEGWRGGRCEQGMDVRVRKGRLGAPGAPPPPSPFDAPVTGVGP